MTRYKRAYEVGNAAVEATKDLVNMAREIRRLCIQQPGWNEQVNPENWGSFAKAKKIADKNGSRLAPAEEAILNEKYKEWKEYKDISDKLIARVTELFNDMYNDIKGVGEKVGPTTPSYSYTSLSGSKNTAQGRDILRSNHKFEATDSAGDQVYINIGQHKDMDESLAGELVRIKKAIKKKVTKKKATKKKASKKKANKTKKKAKKKAKKNTKKKATKKKKTK